jgi:cyclopropane fatty-acyl-phospholipid synthase-like methyltransferase
LHWLNYSEACARNQDAILGSLAPRLKQTATVLEIGSGSGQHAVHFAGALTHLRWQPTDLAPNLAALGANLRQFGSSNILPARELDVNATDWPGAQYDAIYSANTLHIMGWSDVCALLQGVGRVLTPGGLLCLYGPFRYQGRYTSASNADFDRWLQLRDPRSGIRDVEAIEQQAHHQGLSLEADIAMPANNQLLIWRRQDVAN